MKKNIILMSAVTALFFTACGGSSASSTNSDIVSKESLGESLFFDQNLSLTKNTSCATCHDPDHAFVDARFSKAGVDQTVFINGALSVGDDNSSLGGRNAPTATYAMFSPTFDATTVTGGQFHDGRAATLKDQAMGPPLDGAEMMMPDRASVVDRIKENPIYVTAFKSLFSNTVFDNVDTAYEAMGEAIGKFEKTDLFAPFDSKYDRYLKGDYNMTNDERGGLALFFSNNNTNCSQCHQLKNLAESEGEIFTNYKYENIGTPKNAIALQARANLGLGGVNDIDHGGLNQGAADGAIKVPTLRNIAVTGPYMSSGVFKELKTVLEFYDHMSRPASRRLNNPETGQPWANPNVVATINTELLEDTRELTDRKIVQLEAFLKTLTDARYEHLIP
jgi:cytochrome c peroxidase